MVSQQDSVALPGNESPDVTLHGDHSAPGGPILLHLHVAPPVRLYFDGGFLATQFRHQSGYSAKVTISRLNFIDELNLYFTVL